MAKEKKKGLMTEFKEFIMRGNIVDMAVGVIIAGAFTKIVTSLTNDIIMPLINTVFYLLGAKDSELITVLNGQDYKVAVETLDANGEKVTTLELNPDCIYINWSKFIEAIINFLLIALVLFAIVKIINTVRNKMDARKAALEAKLHAEEIAAAEAKAAEEAAAAEEQAKLDAEAKAKADKEKAESMTTNELLVELINKLSK